jgi:hypothetical protein
MAVEVIGAGVGRTGTHSLKQAPEQLLGGRCHHMVICARLGVAVPDEPFPLTNTTSQTRELPGMPALTSPA